MEPNIDVIKLIGKGSFSNVYLCRDTEMEGLSETKFIVKEININTLVRKYMSKNDKRVVKSTVKHGFTPYQECDLRIPESDYYYKRLSQLIETEIEVLKMMDHQNIIKFFKHTSAFDMYFLHMEYCDIGVVNDLLKADDSEGFRKNIYGGMELSFVYEFIKQVSKGVKHMHDSNIIHRDIKLQNILIKSGTTCEFKISDFGFACYDMSNSEGEKDTVLGKKYNRVCGTPYYMAPELIRNMKRLENFTKYTDKDCLDKSTKFYDKGIDIWSLGVCIYELIYNRVIFPDVIVTMAQLDDFLRDIQQDYIDMMIKNSSCLDGNLETILSKMLKIKRGERMTATELCQFVEVNMATRPTKELNLMDEKTYEPHSYLDTNVRITSSLKRDIVTNPIDDSILDSWQSITSYQESTFKFFDWLLGTLWRGKR